MANADGYALAILATGANARVQFHVVANHGNPRQGIGTIADQGCTLDGCADFSVIYQIGFGCRKHELARCDINLAATKINGIEPGFDAFNDSRKPFDVRFYLVAILFIIFDLEIAFLFPWAVALGEIGLLGFWSMIVFLGVLTIGFIYEWKKGALEWE